MNSRKAAGCEGRTRNVILSVPPCAFNGDAAAREPVDGREREALSLTVVPSQTRENPEVGTDRLIKTDPRAVLEGADAIRKRNIWLGADRCRKFQRFPVVATLVTI